MAKLDTNPTLAVHLEENRPFVYAHLLKFERPLKEWTDPNATVLYSEKYSRYMHITDASYSINFDDGSEYYSGQSLLSNGAQTYFPNKLISVSSVQDSAESKVANFNITLAADALDASLYSQTLTFSQVSSDYFIEAVDSFSAAGFTEGDVIYLNSSTGVHKFKKFVIAAFLNEGKKLRVLEETYSFTEDTWAETGNTYDITSSSTEITALTLNQQSANFVNRQVSIFKAFFYEDEPDVFIGSPVLLFSGIITSANYKEDPEKRATISWTCKSHWGDFQQVRGRVGSDDFHRALNSSGKPQPNATIRPEYAQDLGFQHANNAVNIIGLYTTTETEYKQVWRNKLLGTKKLKEIEVEVENEVDLRFNLSAKYIPLVYGVRRIEGTPFFADTNLDASKLYLAEVLSEGPIQSILNIYVEDQPLICISEQDSAVRSSGSDSVDVVCYGRADRGQVLSGTSSVSTNFTISSGYSLNGGSTYEEDTSRAIDEAVAAGSAVTTGGTYVKVRSAWYVPSPVTTTNEGQKGITHQEGIRLSSPGSIDIDFKSGLADQTASSSFATIANNTGFKLQSDYFGSGSNSAAQYWGGEHRVLDTAYTTSEFAISAEQTTAPSIDYVIKGKLVESFNYDGSFGHIGSLESEDNFSLGDTVSIKTIAGVALASNVTVIDKWYYFDGQGNQNYRFRWNLTALQEQSLLNAKAFYMEKGSDTWTMSTYDYKEGNVFQVEKTLEEEVISVSSTPSQDLQVQTNLANLSASDLGTDSAVQAAIKIDAPARELDGVSSGIPAQIKASISDTTTATESTGAITLPGVATNDFDTVVDSTEVSTFIVVLNKIKLSANANLSNVVDYYKGKEVSITKVDSNGNKIEITRPITAYDPTNRILTISPDFVLSEVPESTDTVVILGTPEGQDIRPTNNFALMLLDYLRSKRYGAGLRLDSKLNKDSFLQSARTCDTRSDITLTATNPGGLAPGDVYTYAPNSVFKWRGTIKAVTISGSNATIVFGDCIGKLTHKFSKINSREINDIVWDEGGSQTSLITSAGLQTIITSNASSITTFSLSGPSTLTVAAPAGANPVSYSLYDSDFITYWKYIGWDSPDQRWVTRHQGNITIDTSQPVFNVIGSLLDHFNGILSFEDGKFALSVETKKDSDKDLFWNFLSSPEGWSVTGGTLTSSEEYATISGAGVELEKAGLSFIGNENAVIKARIRGLNIGSSWQGRVYYSTDTHGFSNSYYKDINVPTGFGSLDEWSIASWDMSDLTVGGNDYTNNFITGLAFDLGVNFDIEWISVGSSLRVIEQEDIVGSLTIKDEGLSKSYNSLSASIVDPANNFNTRSVSFFNSEYLKQDRGVVRSGSYQLEGITNYYNARLAVEQTLNRSRFSRQVSFTLRPVGLALSPGDIIRVKYPRFGWDTGKYFRIQSLTYQTNCMVSIVATEHDDSIYFIDAPKVSPYSVTRDFQALVKVPDAPSNLEATNDGTSPSTEILDGIRLTWDKAASENIRSRAYYEIHRSVNSDFTGAVKIATIPHNSSPTYLDTLQPTTRTSYYYKIRTANEVRIQTTNLRETKVYYSDFFPATAVEGTTQAKFNNYIVPLYQKTTTNVAPTKPSNTLTYTFSTNSLSGTPDNGWSTTLPNNADKYSWRIEQPVSSITDSVEISTWNEPSLFAEQGADGTGVNIVFIRKASVPTTPITASPGVPDDPEQWYDSPPAGTDILWASQGFKAVGETNYTWGDPYQVEGTAVAEIYQYRLNDATIDNSAQYNFVTNTFTPATNWSASPPSVSSNLDIVYVSVGLFIGGPTNTAATTTWSAPTVYAFRQDGSIGNDAKAVKLTPSSHVINYSTAGAETDTITFTTAVQSISGSPRYRFLVDGTQKQNGTSLTTFELADADEPSIGGVKEVKVEVYDTSTSPDTLLATDTVSIYAVQDGSDAVMGFLTNNAHTVSAGYDGTLASGALDTAGGTFKVFVGGTDVTTSCTFSVSGTPSNITTTMGANTGTYAITALSADIANVTYQAVIPAATAGTAADVTITAIYSISKSKKGTSISSVSKSTDTVTVTLEDGTTDTFTVNGVSSVNKSGSQLTITYDDGTTSVVDDGNGISSVVKSDQTVTVTYDDSTTNTFTVEDAIQGDPDYVTVSNITKSSSGTYSEDHLDVDFTFRQVGTVKAKRRYRLARSGASWGALTTRDDDITDEINTSQLTETVSISGKNAIVTVQYDDGASTPTVLSTATAQFTIVDDGLGISSVAKVGSTVTVTYDNAGTDTFTVNGVSSVNKSGSQLTITYDDGTTSVVDDGNGISSVVKSDQTVTVTYDDSTTNTFTVEDAIQGDPDYVTVSNITKSSSGTYSEDHLDVDFTFRQVGTVKAKRRYRLARSGASWGALTTRDDDITDEINTSQLTETVSISGKNAIVTVQYDDGASTPTVLSTATAQFTIVDDGLGISSVAKVGSTVTVTYDNAGTDTFTVNGVSSVNKSGSQLTITYDDGTTSVVDDGNGISSVVKSDQTVTVTYDDSTTNTFTVEDAIQGDPDYVTVSNITKSSSGTYSEDHLDVDFTFRQVGTVKAKRRYRLARSGASWGALTTRDDDITDEINTSQLTETVSISGKNAIVTVQYDDGASTPTVLSTATAQFTIVDDGLGISSVAKVGSTVTVTYDNAGTDTFTVNGVSSVNKAGSQLTITYDDGTTSVVDDGNGISSVVKSDQTVTVTYDDSTTNTFTVEDAIQGDPDYVTVSNITKSSSGTYSEDHLDVDFTFRQVGTVKAKRRYRLARSGASWGALTTRDDDITDEINTSQLTETVSISGKNAIVTVQYDDGASTPTVLSTATAQFTIVDDGLGISSVAKVGSTVTVTYDNAGTDTFTVNGVSSVNKAGSELTITYDDGTTSVVDDGNGISSVVKSDQTVTVTYDDSTTNTFTVEDAIQGDPDYVTVSNITRANDGTTYSADYLDLDFTFRQVGTVKAKRRYRLARSGASWDALTTRDDDITDELNVPQLTASASIDNQNAIVTVQYDDGASTPTVLSTATATVSIILFGTDGSPGNPGTNAPRTATGFVYSTQNSTGPAASGNVTYTFSTNAVSNLDSNWSLTPPEISSNQTIMYYSRYTVVETVTNNVLQNTGTMTFSGIGTGTSFNGLVTFQAASGNTPGEFQTGGSNITGINGGAIFTNTITATQLEISDSTGTGTGIFMDGTNNSIKIYQGTTLRVRIGNLVDD